MRSIKEAKALRGKRVLVRVDFNVPLVKGKIGREEDWRLRKTLPTIEYLMKHGARVILASHLGRPDGKKDAKLKMDAVAKRLAVLLHREVAKIGECVGPKVQKAVESLKDGGILLLENLRFNPGEEDNDPKFAKQLAALADAYVNDSFATCHRAAASLVAITKELPSYAGLLLLEEVEALKRVMAKPARPHLVVMGGAKVSSKIGTIENLLTIADRILLGGALANPFYQASGFGIGKSICGAEDLEAAKRLMRLPEARKLILPHDVVIGNPADLAVRAQVRELRRAPFDLCGPDEAILDIGPKTVSAYASYLRSAKTIIWNGPLGWFEVPKFSHGTMALGRLIAARSKGRTFGVVGGGESVMALEKTGLMDCVDHVSTGGGAMLEFLEGKELPGLKALSSKKK